MSDNLEALRGYIKDRVLYGDSAFFATEDAESCANEIERMRFLLHEARGAIFCWNPVSEAGNKMQEEIINAIDAELEEKE